MNKTLYFSDTPTQVVNATNLAYQLGHQADLIVYDQFDQAVKYAALLRGKGPFENLWILPKMHELSNWQRRFDLYSVWGSPGGITIPIPFDDYEYFALACPTRVSNRIFAQLPNGTQTLYFEDGTGTYTGNVFRELSYPRMLPDGVPRREWHVEAQRLLLSCLTKRYNVQPSAMYAYRPEVISCKYPWPIKRLDYDSRAIDIFTVEHLLKAAEEFAEKNATVLLFDAPRVAQSDIERMHELAALNDWMEKNGLQFYVKAHPRTKNADLLYENIRLFPDVNWELFSYYVDISDWLLIGQCSSAMLTPRLQFGKRPELLFLKDDHACASRGEEVIRDNIIQCARCSYGDQSDHVTCVNGLEGALERLRLYCA